LFLSADPDRFVPAPAQLRKKNRDLIRNADLLCYPPGSFYTSLIANLLPDGVSKAIASNDCPKVYIPNLGHDPEQTGMTMDASIQTLLRYLRAHADVEHDAERFLSFVMIDSSHGSYPERASAELLGELGIQLIETKLVSRHSAPYYDPKLLVSALLSLT